MATSISRTEKKSRGRPRKDPTSIHLTLVPDLLARVDKWINQQEPTPSRPEAIRRLVEQSLTETAAGHPPSKATARKASELAAREIDQLADNTATGEERASRKRRLIAGPKEFRGIRRK